MAATKTGTRTNQLATFLFSFYFVSSLSGTIIHTNTLNHWVHGGNTQFCVGQLMGDAVRWKEKKTFYQAAQQHILPFRLTRLDWPRGGQHVALRLQPPSPLGGVLSPLQYKTRRNYNNDGPIEEILCLDARQTCRHDDAEMPSEF